MVGAKIFHSMADAIERELHEVGVSLFRDSLFVGPPGLPLCAQGPIASTLEVPILGEKVEGSATKLLGKETTQMSRF